ncbi:SREBP regulating gene protein isoform X7 [Phacochoerus africanus]|uniref:SREBP regulating gene protein isoform X7 n=1 Tax=Phacochoerus africanus TaxID=41426 RepID=UPI001FDAA52E|nr:SREBP regulating gene protein isoform X7 [Phacochoerus africanus]
MISPFHGKCNLTWATAVGPATSAGIPSKGSTSSRMNWQLLLERFLNRAAVAFQNLFMAVEDHFELCLAKCRTSSQSCAVIRSSVLPKASKIGVLYPFRSWENFGLGTSIRDSIYFCPETSRASWCRSPQVSGTQHGAEVSMSLPLTCQWIPSSHPGFPVFKRRLITVKQFEVLV